MILRSLLTLALLPAQAQAPDGCDNNLAWKCGDKCIQRTEQKPSGQKTYVQTYCNCSGTIFDKFMGKWCCHSEPCEGRGERNEEYNQWNGEYVNGKLVGANCNGAVLSLNEACGGVIFKVSARYFFRNTWKQVGWDKLPMTG